MNIVVCVKQVPDTASDRKLSESDNTLERAAADPWINELDEFGIEAALQIIEKEGGEVTVLTIGPDKAADTIRKALSMGADKAVHVSDDAIHGSDSLIISEIIAKAASRIGFDLLILGSEATDAKMGIMASMVVRAARAAAAVVRDQDLGRRQDRHASTGSPTTATTPSRPPCPPW